MNLQLFDPGVGPNGLLENTRAPIFTRPGKGPFHEGLEFRYHDGIQTQVGDEFLGRALVATDNNDFAPRIGLAYSPTDRWTVRSGFGVFYTQDTGNPRSDLGRNLAGRSAFNSDEERPNSNLSDPFKFERQNFPCAGWDGLCQGPPSALNNNTRRRTPYLSQWVFNVQRQLTNDTVIEVGYQGSSGHKLERFRNYNEPVLRTGPNDARSITQRRPWPAFTSVFMVDGVSNSNYNALSVKLQRRFSQGLTYLVGYTWAKSIDDGSGIRNREGDRLFPRNSYDMKPERGLSQFHQGRRLVSSFLYDLPFGQGKMFGNRPGALNKLIGGWQVGSILTFADGSPIDAGRDGDATGINPIPENRSPDNYFNPAAFDRNKPELQFRFGNVARNVLISPGLGQWDFAVIKNTGIKEGHRLQFRFEAFDFSNHPNFNAPAVDLLSLATFGRISSARTMRELQFGLKYVF